MLKFFGNLAHFILEGKEEGPEADTLLIAQIVAEPNGDLEKSIKGFPVRITGEYFGPRSAQATIRGGF